MVHKNNKNKKSMTLLNKLIPLINVDLLRIYFLREMIVCFFVSISLSGFAYKKFTLPSKILNMKRNYLIYSPSKYYTDDESHPVLYLLHGHKDNHNDTGCNVDNLINNASQAQIQQTKSIRRYISIGDDDFLLKGSSQFHIISKLIDSS
jgi:hypothetical protein